MWLLRKTMRRQQAKTASGSGSRRTMVCLPCADGVMLHCDMLVELCNRG